MTCAFMLTRQDALLLFFVDGGGGEVGGGVFLRQFTSTMRSGNFLTMIEVPCRL